MELRIVSVSLNSVYLKSFTTLSIANDLTNANAVAGGEKTDLLKALSASNSELELLYDVENPLCTLPVNGGRSPTFINRSL